MSTQNLSSVATDVIKSYGIAATNVINGYRFGGARLAGFVDQQFETVVNRGAAILRADLRSGLIGQQQRLSGYCVKGVDFGGLRAQDAVGVAVDLANKSVSLMASGADRLDRASNLNALQTLNRVALPAAQIVVMVAERIEEGSSALVKRVAGNHMPAKAVAKRKLDATTRQAASTRKRVTKTATQRVSKAVAEVAAETSNAARRTARSAKTAGKQAGNAVAKGATQASNAARRVARKAKATA